MRSAVRREDFAGTLPNCVGSIGRWRAVRLAAGLALSLVVWLAGASIARADFTVPVGSTFSGSVGQFSVAPDCEKTNNTIVCVPGGAPSNPTISWGDGTTSAGQSSCITGCQSNAATKRYSVHGSHTYAAIGSYSYSVTGVGIIGKATVTAAPLTAGTAAPLTGVEGADLGDKEVGTFTSGDPNASASDFSASVNWGDGETDTGVVSAAGGGFQVSADHTYASSGPYSITVTVAGPAGSGVSLSDTATISTATLTAGPAVTLTGAQGAALGDPAVATFSDGNPRASASAFSATVDWGDGETDSGAVSAQAGGFEVSADHAYTTPGAYPVTVTITNVEGPAVTVSSAAAIGGTVPAVAATAETSYSGTLAAFNDTFPDTQPSDISAAVNWGDGQTTPGTVAQPGGGGFVVSGSHTYLGKGADPITVTITAPGVPNFTITGAAQVAVATPLAGTAPNATAIEGSPYTGTLATFSDVTPNAAAADFSASIDWGDGSSDAGTVAAAVGSAGFTISGSHTYRTAGTYPVKVSVSSASGAITIAGTAVVQDAPLTAGPPVTINAFQGAPSSGVLASFTDANPFGSPTDYTATVDWGDGTTAQGATVSPVPSGGYQVAGSHTWGGQATYSVTVTVADGGGSSVVIHDTASVGSAPGPVTKIVPTPANPNGDNGWYVTPVHVAVSADGHGVPITTTRCALDPATVPTTLDALGAGCAFSGAGASITSGDHTIYAASANAAGQTESPKSATIKVDTAPPTITCGSAPDFVQGGSGEDVTAGVADALSGPASSTVATPASVASTGDKHAELTGRDLAGNVSTVRCPYSVLGHLNSTLEWGWKHDGGDAVPVQLYATHVPADARIKAFCHGGGCPFASRTTTATAKSDCAGRKCHKPRRHAAGTVDLAPWFKDSRLAVRARLQISIVEAERFGFTWVFVIRRKQDPVAAKSCLRPGSFTDVVTNC
jgi:PKD repeat protein